MQLTRFLYALWMASMASLMVTPLRFLAVTSIPKGKCRSIFLTGGFVKCILRIEGSSIDMGLELIFLRKELSASTYSWQDTTTAKGLRGRIQYGDGDLPPRFLSLDRKLQLNPILLCARGHMLAGLLCEGLVTLRLWVRSVSEEAASLPRSLMFMTPAALELCLLWPFSLGGEDDKPWTAESTLESGSVMVGAGGDDDQDDGVIAMPSGRVSFGRRYEQVAEELSRCP